MKNNKSMFRVMYKVYPEDTPINMSVNTRSLGELHKILCGMNSYRTRTAEWDTLVIHEHHEDGTVTEIPQAHIAFRYDYLYGFKGGRPPEREEDEDMMPINEPLSRVTVVRRKSAQPKVSTAAWWKEKRNAYH